MSSDTTRSVGCQQQQGPLYNKPSIKTLQSHGIINDIGPHWYNLGIALLDEDQLAQLQIIRCNHDNETGRCIDLFIYWLQSHPKATWYDLVEKLKSNGVELNTVAEKVEGIFPAVEPKNYAAVVMVAVASSDEPGEEKLILSETNDQTKIQISTQPKSEIVKPTTSSHKIPTQHLNEDVTIHATDSITERVKSMTLQNGSHCGLSHSSDSTAGLQGDTIDCSTKMEDCKISERVCKAVKDFYCGQFKDRWQVRTDSSPVNVVAALLVEKKGGELKVVVLSTGTIKKRECSYSLNKGNADGFIDECTWGVCDGHAESVCYRLASLYLVTEIHKCGKDPDNSILECKFGYALKEGIKFHFFTTQPPCGFMAKEQRHFLSWKIPFTKKPHCLKCSSTILIGAYLGIQGPLSHLFRKPIYISSITIPKSKFKSVNAQKINWCFKMFKDRLDQKSKDTDGSYHLVIPDVEVADVQSEDLFECFKSYSDDRFSSSNNFQQLETEERYAENKTKKTAGAVSDDGNVGSRIMVFALKNGIDKKEFHEKIKLQVKDATKDFTSQELIAMKNMNLQKLQEAQVRLSAALSIKEALEKLKSLITEKINARFITHCSDDEVIVQLKEIEECRLKMGKLAEQVSKLKDSFCAAVKQFENDPNVRTEITSSTSLGESTKRFKSDSESMIEDVDLLNKSIKGFGNGTKSIVDELTDYRDYKETLDDLNKFLKEGDTSSCDSLFDLDLMGCDWARYMKLILADIEKSS